MVAVVECECGISVVLRCCVMEVLCFNQLARSAVGDFDVNRALVRGSGSDAWDNPKNRRQRLSRRHGVANIRTGRVDLNQRTT